MGMREDLRNKLRFLKHIPVTCYFEVAELALSKQIVSAKTRDYFGPQLDQRKRKRAQRARAEKRREKRILVEENKLMGKFPGLPKSLRIESDFHFPAVGNQPANIFSSDHCLSNDSAASVDSRNSSPHFDIRESTGHRNHGPSAGNSSGFSISGSSNSQGG